MPRLAIRRTVPYAREDVFDIVADVERYPEFLPGCTSARILRRDGERLWVEQSVGLSGLSWRFRTTALLARPDRIEIGTREAPFAYLDQVWRFREPGPGTTEVELAVNYELRSSLLETVASGLFDEGFRQSLAAFERRIHERLG